MQVGTARHRCGTAVALATAAIALSALPALAIGCRDGYQRVQGQDIATPYCQDEYLAAVARQYGMKASGERVRNNPNYKREVCRLVGQDIRVQSNCLDEVRPSPSGRF